MDILHTWVDKDSKRERAKLYRNIDPESIKIIGLKIYFTHMGVTREPRDSIANHYAVDIAYCPYFITDPVLIKQEMERFTFTGDLGYCNQIAELKEGCL